MEKATSRLPSFKLGNFSFSTPLILAPMAGVTDRPFRQLCKSLGASMAVSEMVGAHSLFHGSEKTHRRANHEGETTPKSVQIVGAQPKMMALAAKINEEKGADIIDINMGCPAKKICNTLAGSALMKDEPLVKSILKSVVDAVDIPVTLKIRTGWDLCHRNGPNIAKIAQDMGIQALAVHGRTRACKFKGEAEYDTIAQIKSIVDIPVFANGDIKSPEQAKQVLEYTRADGLMIGRAAQGRPWIFQEIAHYLKEGTQLKAPCLLQIKQWLVSHLENLYAFYGEERGVFIARKHVSWYSKGQRGGAHFRHQFNQLNTAKAQLNSINAFFLSLSEGKQYDHTND